jgi:hypothetical protein
LEAKGERDGLKRDIKEPADGLDAADAADKLLEPVA